MQDAALRREPYPKFVVLVYTVRLYIDNLEDLDLDLDMDKFNQGAPLCAPPFY